MRRWFLPALMISLLLCGCGNDAAGRKLDAMRAALNAATEISATADITANLGDERFRCTVICRATSDQTVVELTAPESIAGIRAVVGADGTTIEYADVSLGIGSLGMEAAPVTALPLILTALRSGSTIRSWTEREEQRTLFVRELYISEETALTLWLDASALLPVHAEFVQDGGVVLCCEIRDFSYE